MDDRILILQGFFPIFPDGHVPVNESDLIFNTAVKGRSVRIVPVNLSSEAIEHRDLIAAF